MQLVYSLFDLLAFALIGATLLRGWMIAAGLTLVVQPGRFVVAVTDWLVQPLRRILPGGMSLGRWDGACVFAALILALAYGGLWTALLVSNSGAQVALSTWMLAIPVAALKMLARGSAARAFLSVADVRRAVMGTTAVARHGVLRPFN